MVKFNVEMIHDVFIEIDEDVLQSVDDKWRETFYNLRDDNEIVKHIAYNALVNKLNLSEMDGFADKDDSQMMVIPIDYDINIY